MRRKPLRVKRSSSMVETKEEQSSKRKLFPLYLTSAQGGRSRHGSVFEKDVDHDLVCKRYRRHYKVKKREKEKERNKQKRKEVKGENFKFAYRN
ncbi:unnamed protein product [Angiostrongylus costaricensis]|uniref:Uncharacterized protein n=1 Tax=Angiostrongylus costaricensis TaxID=334426 RepID=A0A0R3PP26_ANGCS|nr:unnamed protein product [Angiostrongylus costaricensis]